MMRHQYGFSALVSQTSFREEIRSQWWRREMLTVFSGYLFFFDHILKMKSREKSAQKNSGGFSPDTTL